tara:strand:- start:92 stop:517 length:426 start_codon:yes stop_codon:yes gene_type:complete
MARPRVNQFAKDMGLTRNQAQRLINEGRRRKDGGSEILDSYSPELRQRMQRYEDAERIFTEDTRIGTMSEKKKMKLPKRSPVRKKKIEDRDRKAKQDQTENPGTLPIEQADEDQLRAMGILEQRSRGGGIAIQGMKFIGVR